MKINTITKHYTIGISICLIVFTSLAQVTSPNKNNQDQELLKSEAFFILKTKCNICHKKQNPFMIFTERNMVKRAPKIHQMVFVEKRMPKGNTIRLSPTEYSKLENWLHSLNIQ